MKSFQYGPVITVVAGEALTKRRFVDFEGKHTADLKCQGVTLDDSDSGDPVSVQKSGIALVEASGAITAGSHVKSDGDGKAAALTFSATADVPKDCGVAKDAATTDGDIIRVSLP